MLFQVRVVLNGSREKGNEYALLQINHKRKLLTSPPPMSNVTKVSAAVRFVVHKTVRIVRDCDGIMNSPSVTLD